MTTWFHGGAPGLREGDSILPGHSRDHNHPGCATCARRRLGARDGIDPASHRSESVYVTRDLEYARYHASLYGRGDLYEVRPLGETEHSFEDLFPTVTCSSAVVVRRVERAVLLSMNQRREFYVRWAALEGFGRRVALAEFKRMVKRVRKGLTVQEGSTR